jgi:replicative DNA helicase
LIIYSQNQNLSKKKLEKGSEFSNFEILYMKNSMAVKNPRKETSIAKINPEYGRIPPQAVDLEEAVLGAIMLEKDAVIAVLDILKPESFYKEAHQKLYRAIIDLSMREEPIDILTVTEELKKKELLAEVGGALYITQLTSRVASAAHLEYHARIVAQKYIQRELIRVSSEIQARAYDESYDVDELLDFSEAQLFEIAEGNIKKETAKINQLIKEAIHQIEEASKREDALSGVPSGFTKLDRLTSGWQRSDLIIIAARPSMGKTAFVLSMTRNMAVEHKRAVAMFSLEMSSIQLVNRLIVAETELPSDRIRNGRLEQYEWEQLEYRIKGLIEAPIYIDDTPAISIYEIRAKCRRLKNLYDIQVIIIDYLQLMSGSGDARGNREQEVSTLSQLNRSVELRSGSKRPQLSDLRESGAIEQDADIVCFIHRPEKYGMDVDEEGNSTKGIAEIIMAKHRNGAIGDITLRFREEFAKFTELDEINPVFEEESGTPIVTFGSKMNEDFKKGKDNSFDIGQNNGFEDQPF